MKKIFILLFLITSYFQDSFSQNFLDYTPFPNENGGYSYYQVSSPISWDQIKEFNISKIELFTKETEKGKNRSGYRYYYDSIGNIILYKRFDKKSQLKYTTEYAWDNNIKIYQKTSNSKGKITNETKYEKDSLNNIVSSKTYRDGKLYFETLTTYEEQLINSISYYKKGNLWQKYIYLYYPNGQKKETNRYDKKGKLKMTWSFACTDEGEKVEKRKRDTINYCKWLEHDTIGNLIEVTLRTDEKNMIRKYVKIYSPDSVLLESKTYTKDDILVYHAKIDTNNFSSSQTFSYRENGSLRSTSSYIYISPSRLSSNLYIGYNKRGKVKYSSTSKYIYNNRGLIISQERVTEKGHYSSTYSYEYF